MAGGETISAEEAHEVLEPLDCVVIGDPDECRRKVEAYKRIGIDRMMCMMQFGRIPPEAVLRSLELTGRELIPTFEPLEPVT
jgi:alkanesulfonate monooxygenase SsuD/methylene tetrahydromethanopterin reductase-like flavin-dependent oxidoreductase (luciferase family)